MRGIGLTGVVDGMPTPQTLSGWARSTDLAEVPGAGVVVRHAASGAVLGQAAVDRFRPDCRQHCGFQARLNRPVSLAELQDGSVQVLASLPGGRDYPLSIWPGLRAPVQQMQALDRHFLDYCRHQGFDFRPADRRAHTDLTVELPCTLAVGSVGRNLAIGAYTEVAGQVGSSIANARIGRFCSLANRVTIAPDEHPTDYLSSSMVQYVPNVHEWDSFLEAAGQPRQAPVVAFAQRGRTILGHDVRVGSNVFIRQGVRVGDGAILTAGSVVVADVPPYTVVGGVPARVIRDRFSEDIVERLLALRWWNHDVLAVPELRFDRIEDAVSLLEDKLAAGELAPLAVRRTTLAELHAGWTAGRQQAG